MNFYILSKICLCKIFLKYKNKPLISFKYVLSHLLKLSTITFKLFISTMYDLWKSLNKVVKIPAKFNEKIKKGFRYINK